ncbi:hypothetical protein BJY04DRAFT_214722 [Aspergillus karnatakaensis]|uniref:DUF4188 domain-containing protein n=1 Tax=Aspergillus karnatakaensis TaxID=1810916 RepID=UPI003CCE231A
MAPKSQSKPFTPLLPAHILPAGKTISQTPLSVGEESLSPVFRDNFTITTWLLLGALFQGALLTLFGSLALLPAILLTLYKAVDTTLMATGLTRNRYLDGIIKTKYGSQHPNPDGSFGSEPSSKGIVVFLLGSKCNHPLGILAPGFAELGKRGDALVASYKERSEEYGLLNMKTWIGQTHDSGNEIVTVFYLRDYESLHKFAHDELHMDTVRWWGQVVKKYPHIAIYHETYVVPEGHWENIYAQSHPTGMGGAMFPFRKSVKGEVQEGWARGVIEQKGVLRSASGRLKGMSYLREREMEGDELYDMPI